MAYFFFPSAVRTLSFVPYSLNQGCPCNSWFKKTQAISASPIQQGTALHPCHDFTVEHLDPIFTGAAVVEIILHHFLIYDLFEEM